MAKYVPDIRTQRWVVIAPGRVARPEDVKEPGNGQCPFCPGNEAMTPPEVYRIGPGEKDKSGWLVRVVPNKFPITDIHEVIIHSPDEEKDIEVLPIEQVTHVLTAYRDRYRAHEASGQVMIFCNHGEHAGASLRHPHSQLVVVPRQINLDALSREPITNLVEENTNFVTYCPDFCQWPLEVWITPKEDGTRFGDLPDNHVLDLAQILQTALRKIEVTARDTFAIHPGKFVYNYYIYHGVNWFIRIIPRLVHRAGFELGSGLSVNIVDPTEAAKKLKEIQLGE
ncbi:MAG: DUF4931 domain-containing protein [Patescibacteria group bacterium]